MDDDKSLEQQASEDLAELEAEEAAAQTQKRAVQMLNDTHAESILAFTARVEALESDAKGFGKAVAELEDLKDTVSKEASRLSGLYWSLTRALAAHEDLKNTTRSIINELVTANRRLDRLDPSFNQHNCSKCGAKLRHVGGKCHVCGFQN